MKLVKNKLETKFEAKISWKMKTREFGLKALLELSYYLRGGRKLSTLAAQSSMLKTSR